MGQEFKINEFGEIIRGNNDFEKYSSDEESLLKGEKVKAHIRRKIARETKNEDVLWKCVRDNAITVVLAAKENPILTPAMKTEIRKQEDAYNGLQQYKIEESIKNNSEKNDNDGKGCLWFIIIACALGLLYSYLSGEAWFPF